MRKLANECGLDFLKDSIVVADHFNAAPAGAGGEESGALYGGLQTPQLQPHVVGASVKKVLFKGLAHNLASSHLTFNVLSGFGTAYAVAKDAKEVHADNVVLSGVGVNLVSAMQARNSARAVFMGGLDV